MKKFIKIIIILLIASTILTIIAPIRWEAGPFANEYEKHIFDKYTDILVNKFHNNADDKELISNIEIVQSSKYVSWEGRTIDVYFSVEYNHSSKGKMKEKLHFIGKRIWIDTFKWSYETVG